MGFIGKIQRYLGLEPVQVRKSYRRAERAAQLACTRCGAFVAHEHQALHSRWHREAAS